MCRAAAKRCYTRDRTSGGQLDRRRISLLFTRTMIDRRAFVRSLLATLVASTFNISLLAAAPRRRKLRARRLRRNLNEFFELQGEHWHRVELVEIHEISSNRNLEQFSLVFRGSIHDSVTEGIYTIKPSRGRSFDATVHPAGNEGAFNYYISHFSLIQPRLAPALRREERRRPRRGE